MPPSFIEALDNIVKADLLNWRDMWFHCLLWSTGAVALGLAFEGPELWYEIRHTWLDRCDRRMFFAPTPHEVPPRWKVIAFIGWFLIVLGVAGEGIFETMVSRADGQLQTFNDTLLKAAQREAGDAATSAKIAHDEADAAKVESATARKDAGDAVAKAHAAERSLAKAEADAGKAQTAAANALTTATDAAARAGKAEASLGEAEASAKNAENSASNALTLAREARQEAASFESDLARLKQQAADRVLDEYQQGQVRLKVEPFFVTPYELAVADTPEAEKLLYEIDAAVSSAGWLYRGSESKAFRFTKKLHNGKEAEPITLKGIEIGVSPALLGKLKPAADALAKALSFEGIPAIVVKLPENDPSPNNIHIMVGSKP